VGDYAERAVLIPVGAALMASETVTSSVNELISTYSSSRKVEAQLRRFQRRGGSARKRLEQVVRKRRTRVEREFRHRRRDLDRQRTRLTKDFSSQVELAQEQLEKTQTWLEDTLKSSMDGGQDLASRVQERVLSQV
jgi:exonuclease VII large subunit